MENSPLNEDDYRLQFIKEHNIDYIIIRPDASLPASLENLYDMVAKDETGERFYKKK